MHCCEVTPLTMNAPCMWQGTQLAPFRAMAGRTAMSSEDSRPLCCNSLPSAGRYALHAHTVTGILLMHHASDLPSQTQIRRTQAVW